MPPELAASADRAGFAQCEACERRSVCRAGGGDHRRRRLGGQSGRRCCCGSAPRSTLIARRPEIAYCGPPEERNLLGKIKEPESGLGTGWRSWACCTMPMVFHAMPEAFRLMVVQQAFAGRAGMDAQAAGGWHRSHHPGCDDRPSRSCRWPCAAGAEPAGWRKAGPDGRPRHRRDRLSGGHAPTAVLRAGGARSARLRRTIHRGCRDGSRPRFPACISSAPRRQTASDR